MRPLILFLLTSLIVFGQQAWDHGEFSISYGYPFPNQTWSGEGSFVEAGIPGYGVGGFQVVQNDTALLVMMSYELYTQEEDTLADAFLVIMQSDSEFSEGNYAVDMLPGQMKMFAWIREVDPQMILSLLDTNFTPDSLTGLNPFLSISGTLNIQAISPQNFELQISGVMVNTTLNLLTISPASFSLSSNVPALLYPGGSLDHLGNGAETHLNGALNPLLESEGVGAFSTTQGDTLRYTWLAYSAGAEGSYDVYGLELVGLIDDLPDDGSERLIPISIDGATLPRVLPIFAEDIDVAVLMELLQTGNLSGLDLIQQAFVPLGTTDASWSHLNGEGMWISFENLSMMNLSFETQQISQYWEVGTNWSPNPVDQPLQSNKPMAMRLQGIYPNPFNASTRLELQLPQSQKLELRMYNLLGQEKLYRDLGQHGPGMVQYQLDLGETGLQSSLYIIRITNDSGASLQASLLLLK